MQIANELNVEHIHMERERSGRQSRLKWLHSMIKCAKKSMDIAQKASMPLLMPIAIAHEQLRNCNRPIRSHPTQKQYARSID